MRATERMSVLEKIGCELQSRYSFTDVDGFFSAAGINTGDCAHGNSKRLYAKAVLQGATDKEVLRIAGDLGFDGVAASTAQPPANWHETTQFRLFVSHVSKHKAVATRLKGALAPHGISGFVAHEDIYPTLEWQLEIERALHTMDAFLAICTPTFSASVWTQQEIGFALGRNVKIISFKMGEDPPGFIGRHQAIPRLRRTAEDVAIEIGRLLLNDDRTADRVKRAQHRSTDQDLSF